MKVLSREILEVKVESEIPIVVRQPSGWVHLLQSTKRGKKLDRFKNEKKIFYRLEAV